MSDPIKRSEVFTLSRSISTEFEPFTLFQYLIESENKAHAMLFESARTDDQTALKSMLVTKVSLRITALKDIVTVKVTSVVGKHLLDYLKSYFSTELRKDGELSADFQFINDKEKYPRGVLTIIDPLLALKNPEFAPFVGGLFGYDLVGEFYQINVPEKGRERDLCLFFAEEMITLDHQAKTATYEHLYLDYLENARMDAYRTFNETAFNYEQLVKALDQKVAAQTSTLSPELSTAELEGIDAEQKQAISKGTALQAEKAYSQGYPQVDIHQPIVSQQNGVNIPNSAPFKQAIYDFIAQIKAGKLLQIVPSRAFTLPCPSPFASYAELKNAYPSPYLFYLHDEDFTLFGASPESALKYAPDTRELELYPIAGTKKRGLVAGEIDAELDAQMETILKTDKKEVSEHMMLVDLAKEDLALISDPDSIYVKDLMKVDRYRYVMHLVSRVAGRLRSDLSPLDAYLAVMNMGTLTGAPKVYAMQEIYRYEDTARGSYGGAIGYIEGLMIGDRFDSAITIRSAYVQNGVAKVQAGAGIVLDSIAESEVEETENKASSVIMAILKANQKISKIA